MLGQELIVLTYGVVVFLAFLHIIKVIAAVISPEARPKRRVSKEV